MLKRQSPPTWFLSELAVKFGGDRSNCSKVTAFISTFKLAADAILVYVEKSNAIILLDSTYRYLRWCQMLLKIGETLYNLEYFFEIQDGIEYRSTPNMLQ